MHPEALEFTGMILLDLVPGARILEVGSNSTWDSAKNTLMKWGPQEYVGVDMVDGPDVDIKAKIEDTNLSPDYFDIVFSNGTLEHVKNWKAAVHKMKEYCKPGGVILTTVPGPGRPRHNHPSDYWRFTLYDLGRIFRDCDTLFSGKDPNPIENGCFFLVKKPMNFVEASLDEIELEKAPPSEAELILDFHQKVQAEFGTAEEGDVDG